MRTVALRNLGAHKLRLVLTLIAVVLGTAFVAGSFVFTDTLKHSFDKIFATSDANIDARVEPSFIADRGVPATLAQRISDVPGVRAVEPQIDAPIVLIDPNGNKIDTGGAPSQGAAWPEAGQRVSVVPALDSGHAPTRPGQIAINSGVADKHGLHPGAHVRVVLPDAGVVPVTISGVYSVSYDTGGYLGALFARDQAIRLFTDGRHYQALDIAASPGVSEQTLVKRIEPLLPLGLEAKTGDQVRADDSAGVATALSFVNYILLGFGILALLVGTFIIYNTFSMILAQRQRELALLRAIGAGRGQVRRSVALEAAVIGVVGGGIGLAGGVGLAYLLRAVLDALDLGLPSGSMVLSARTIIIALAVGVGVTMLAASAPARRASRIPPVAAMRADLETPGKLGLRRRTAAGAVVGVAGIAVTVSGLSADGAGPASALTGLGLIGVCIAAMLLAPVLARMVITPLGRLVGRPFGTVGRLARTNAIRNPRRTAATGFALTLGLILVAGIAVLGTSIKAGVGRLFDNNVRADYILTTQTQVSVPVPAVAAARTASGVGSITELHDFRVSVDGTHREGTAVDGPLTAVLAVDRTAGRLATSAHDMVVSQSVAEDRGWTVGSTHRLSTPRTAPVTVHVVGEYADDPLLGDWVVSGDVYRALTPRTQWSDEVALVKAAPGTDLASLRTSLDRATNRFYIVQVQDRDQFKGQIAGQVNGLVGLLYGLLGLAIVIAILGIVNTLALSVVERRREIGMLRAVGMQRAQVRRTIYLESTLIAVFGAALGLVIGLVYGSLFTNALNTQGIYPVSIPWGQSLLFLVLAGVVGVLAALWPGIRAARTPPLAAVAEA